MKKKEITNKLTLNKETVADLEKVEMNDVRGGATRDPLCNQNTTPPDTCPEG